MTTQHKCGFCNTVGHTINNCNSEIGDILYNGVKSRAVDFFTSFTDSTIHYRAKSFQNHLKQTYYIKELRVILAKMRCCTSGPIPMLTARIVHHYFFQMRDYYYTLSNHDRSHIFIYGKYWHQISIGYPIEYAQRELDNYFARELKLSSKFQIKISLKSIDVKNNDDNIFECPICMEDNVDISDKVDIGCNHSFCKHCVLRVMSDSQKKGVHPSCALCRQNYNEMHVRSDSVLNKLSVNYCF